MTRARRHRGWMVLCVVATSFAVGVVANALRAVFDHAYGFLVPGGIAFLFWYWIAVGAYRRATLRGPVVEHPTDPT